MGASAGSEHEPVGCPPSPNHRFDPKQSNETGGSLMWQAYEILSDCWSTYPPPEPADIAEQTSATFIFSGSLPACRQNTSLFEEPLGRCNTLAPSLSETVRILPQRCAPSELNSRMAFPSQPLNPSLPILASRSRLPEPLCFDTPLL